MGKRTLKVSVDALLLNMGRMGDEVHYKILGGAVPKDAEIHALSFNKETRCLIYVLESNEFEGEDGDLIPLFQTQRGKE